MDRVYILSFPYSFRGAQQLNVSFSLFMFSCSVAGLINVYARMFLFCLSECSIRHHVKSSQWSFTF